MRFVITLIHEDEGHKYQIHEHVCIARMWHSTLGYYALMLEPYKSEKGLGW